MTPDYLRRVLYVYTYQQEGDSMVTKVNKWGNSLAVRIPRAMAEEAKFTANMEVDLSIKDNQLVVKQIRKPRVKLSELLERITDENLHAEINLGPAVGAEVW